MPTFIYPFLSLLDLSSSHNVLTIQVEIYRLSNKSSTSAEFKGLTVKWPINKRTNVEIHLTRTQKTKKDLLCSIDIQKVQTLIFKQDQQARRFVLPYHKVRYMKVKDAILCSPDFTQQKWISHERKKMKHGAWPSPDSPPTLDSRLVIVHA